MASDRKILFVPGLEQAPSGHILELSDDIKLFVSKLGQILSVEFEFGTLGIVNVELGDL